MLKLNKWLTYTKLDGKRQVLDLEGRLHETLFELSGNRHTFIILDQRPK